MQKNNIYFHKTRLSIECISWHTQSDKNKTLLLLFPYTTGVGGTTTETFHRVFIHKGGGALDLMMVVLEDEEIKVIEEGIS